MLATGFRTSRSPVSIIRFQFAGISSRRLPIIIAFCHLAFAAVASGLASASTRLLCLVHFHRFAAALSLGFLTFLGTPFRLVIIPFRSPPSLVAGHSLVRAPLPGRRAAGHCRPAILFAGRLPLLLIAIFARPPLPLSVATSAPALSALSPFAARPPFVASLCFAAAILLFASLRYASGLRRDRVSPGPLLFAFAASTASSPFLASAIPPPALFFSLLLPLSPPV